MPFTCKYDLFLAMPAECSSYNTITTQGNWKTSASYGFRCFSGNGKTWFRLEGAGGTKIVNSCPPSMKCNTYGSGKPTYSNNNRLDFLALILLFNFIWAQSICL